MSDGEHPELDFDPLDDTKLWPEDQFPFLLWAAWCSIETLPTTSPKWGKRPSAPAS